MLIIHGETAVYREFRGNAYPMVNLDNQIVGKCRPNYKQFEFTYAGFPFPGPIGGYTILECNSKTLFKSP